MNRRDFARTLAGAGWALGAAAKEDKAPFYVVERFLLKNGTQPDRLQTYLRDAALPALAKSLGGPQIVLQAVIAPHMPQVLLLYGIGSLKELSDLHEKITGDAEHTKNFEAWESGPESAVESMNVVILQATDYSPPIVVDPSRKTPRFFELRVYHSPTWRQLRALHERFSGAEIKIFHRCGVHPILYSSTFIGPNMPNLTYLIPFESLDARQKAWDAFGADPEWVRVWKESIDKHGQISSISEISLWRATAYSPLK